MLLKSTVSLGECISTCERIYNTPIPLAYSRHTSRFLVLYVSTLPLVLVGSMGWMTLPVMATISWALFGILEIGNLVEEPFRSVVSAQVPLLPLTEVCRTIRRDVRAFANYSQLAAAYGAPSIQRTPKAEVLLPEGFKALRSVFAIRYNSSKTTANGTAPISTNYSVASPVVRKRGANKTSE